MLLLLLLLLTGTGTVVFCLDGVVMAQVLVVGGIVLAVYMGQAQYWRDNLECSC